MGMCNRSVEGFRKVGMMTGHLDQERQRGVLATLGEDVKSLYDSGIALVRQPEALAAAMSMDAAYLMKGGQRDPFEPNKKTPHRIAARRLVCSLDCRTERT